MELAIVGVPEAQRLIALDYIYGGNCFNVDINALFSHRNKWLPRPDDPKWIAKYENLATQSTSRS
jgi:hypothetical protein